MTDPVSGQPPLAIEPTPRTSRRGWIIGAIVAGAVVLVGATAGIAYGVVAGQHSPEQQAKAFLQDLVDGNAELALDRVSGIPAHSPLLTDEAYAAATDRVSAFEIIGGEVAPNPDHYVVSTKITQGSTEHEQELTLTRVGTEFLFDLWKIDEGQLPEFQVAFPHPSTVIPTASGQELGSLDGGSGVLLALPGTYEFAADGTTDSYSVAPVIATVTFADRAAPAEVALAVVLTEQGLAAAQAAVAAHTDACFAQPVLKPLGGCHYNVVDDGYPLTNQRWTLLVRPTVDFGEWSGDAATGGWIMQRVSLGSLRWDADFAGGTAWASWEDYTPAGRIVSFAENGTAIFESDYVD